MFAKSRVFIGLALAAMSGSGSFALSCVPPDEQLRTQLIAFKNGAPAMLVIGSFQAIEIGRFGLSGENYDPQSIVADAPEEAHEDVSQFRFTGTRIMKDGSETAFETEVAYYRSCHPVWGCGGSLPRGDQSYVDIWAETEASYEGRMGLCREILPDTPDLRAEIEAILKAN